jgi:transposase InsO family protein
MSYSNNPYAPKARRLAVNLVMREGLSVAEAARRSGVHRSTLWRWIRKAEQLGLHGNAYIPTLSPAPPHRTNELTPAVVAAIVAERKRSGRGAYFVHLELREQGVPVSLSSVKRTLRRQSLTRPVSPWKRYRPHVERPHAAHPGALVQIDAIHFMRQDSTRFYVVTVIDLYSRAAYAEYTQKLNQRVTFGVILQAQDYFGIAITMVQADNGGEFGKWFHDQLQARGISLRHSRVRQSNDNAHVERFNRTIQEECLSPSVREATVPDKIYWYLLYYNQFRRHSGIDGGYPMDLLGWKRR